MEKVNEQIKFSDVNTVLIDVDDTIMDFERGQKKAIFSAFGKIGCACTEEQYKDYDSINKKYWKMFERGEIEKNRLIFARFEEFFAKYGIEGDPVEMEYAYQAYLGEQYFYLDGAEEGVKYLKGKYRLYIVTNGIKHTQENRIEKSGLIRYADGVFISEAVGAGKPSKEYFDYVFDFTGADRKSSVIMGDSLTSDIKGGINAGIRTIWFNSKGLPPSDAIVPTCEIHGWDEVYKIL